jgi:hypothetical protein
MKFVYDTTDIIAINDFQNREFFHRDKFILGIDRDKEPKIYKKDIYFQHIYKKENVKKLVDYVNFDDKHKNFNDPKFYKLSFNTDEIVRNVGIVLF